MLLKTTHGLNQVKPMTEEELKDIELDCLREVDLDLQNYQQLYNKGLQLIINEPQPKALLLDILDEYLDRLGEMPAIDLSSKGISALDEDTKEKVKSLVLFGTQAALIKENSTIQNNLREANQNYRDLLSVVTHEFKNTLTSINGYTRLIERRLADQKYTELGEINSNIDRLTNNLYGLVETLFSMSLIDQGRLKIERKIFDIVEDTIHPILAELDLRLQKKNMHVDIKAAQPKNIFYGDEKFFQLIFRNLVLNAIQYGNTASTIDISIAKKGEIVEIQVFNEGSGLPVDKLEKVFEKFSRFHENNGRSNVGIGLYAVKNIIELHDGTISADSEFGKWMRFTITIPFSIEQ